MLNLIWVGLIVAGVVVAGLSGKIEVVTESAMNSARLGVETVIGLAGIMIFWLGMARIAEESGLIKHLGRWLEPVFGRLFPEVPRHHPAMGAMLMNISANLLGLGQAATPFGLRAMQELQKLNPDKDRASYAMVTFLILNTSSVTLIPATVIALRAATGSANPVEIVGPTLVATLASTGIALAIDAIIRQSRSGRD